MGPFNYRLSSPMSNIEQATPPASTMSEALNVFHFSFDSPIRLRLSSLAVYMWERNRTKKDQVAFSKVRRLENSISLLITLS